MEIERHNFKSQDGSIEYDFSISDQVYMNATEQYQVFGKSQQAFNFYKDNTLVPYAEKLIELGKVPKQGSLVVANNEQLTVSELIIVRKGGNTPIERGTWLHPKLQIVYARWLKDEFGIWCDEKIMDLLTNGIVTLQPEDKKWVDIVESLRDAKAGSSWYMKKLREAIIIHEAEGYNIKVFKDLIEMVKLDAGKERQPKVLKKVRLLIKEMYEAREIGRTSHEQMLEHCVDTVVKVLEKEIKSTKSKLKRIILKGSTEKVVDPVVDHNVGVHETKTIVDSQYSFCHKILGLNPTSNEDVITTFVFDQLNPVCECVASIEESKMKVVINYKLYAKPKDASDKLPALQWTDPWTQVGVAVWFNEDGSALCKLQKTSRGELGEKIYQPMVSIKLHSLMNYNPAIWTGTNPENTMRVVLNVANNQCLVYGYSLNK